MNYSAAELDSLLSHHWPSNSPEADDYAISASGVTAWGQFRSCIRHLAFVRSVLASRLADVDWSCEPAAREVCSLASRFAHFYQMAATLRSTLPPELKRETTHYLEVREMAACVVRDAYFASLAGYAMPVSCIERAHALPAGVVGVRETLMAALSSANRAKLKSLYEEWRSEPVSCWSIGRQPLTRDEIEGALSDAVCIESWAGVAARIEEPSPCEALVDRPGRRPTVRGDVGGPSGDVPGDPVLAGRVPG